MTVLKLSGTLPVVREALMIFVMTGTRMSRYSLVRGVGIGPRLQFLGHFSE